MRRLAILLSLALFVFTSCFGDDKLYYATFKADGVVKKMECDSGLCFGEVYDHTFTNTWALLDNDYYTLEQLYINLPSDVSVGDVFDEDSLDLSFDYVPDFSILSEKYSPTSSEEFYLEITRWEGIGGMAEGIFYGTVADGSYTIEIVDGEFQATIDE